MKHTTKHQNDNVCPYCAYVSNRSSCFQGEHVPEEGDISLCMKCAAVNVYTDTLELRKPNEEELEYASNDEHVQELQASIMKISKRDNIQ